MNHLQRLTLGILCIFSANVKGQIYDQFFTPPVNPGTKLHFQLYLPKSIDTVKGVCFYLTGGDMYGIEYMTMEKFIPHRTYFAQKGFAFLVADLNQPVYNVVNYDTIKNWMADGIIEALAAFADSTGHPEVEFSPLFLYGYSNGGFFSTHLNMFMAERILGVYACKGSSWLPINDSIKQKALKVPVMLLTGENDLTVSPNLIIASFNEGRLQDALWSQVIEYGGYHDNVTDTSLVLPFFRDAVRQRLPDKVSFNGIPELKKIDPTTGWMGDNRNFKVAPYDCFNHDKSLNSWFPGKESALAWQKFISKNRINNDIISCNDSSLSSLYFGQEPPGNIAKIFAPGIVSVSGRINIKYDLRKDGKEALLSSHIVSIGKEFHQQYCLSFKNNKWSMPAPIDSIAQGKYLLGTYAPDNNDLFGIDTSNIIWQSKRLNDTIQGPQEIHFSGLRTDIISFTDSGDAYFTGMAKDTALYTATYKNGKFGMPTKINGDFGITPCVSKNGDFIITSDKWDILVTFKQGDNGWSKLINLGSKINSRSQELFPTLSPDNKYIFFSRNSGFLSRDIYWASTSIIDLARNNKPPVISNPFNDLVLYTDSLYSIEVPHDFVVDPNPSDSILTLNFTRSDGSKLPISTYYLSNKKKLITKSNTADTIEIVVMASDYFNITVSDTFKIQFIQRPTEIHQNKITPKAFKIFPNPASSILTIERVEGTNSKILIEIISIEGKTIQRTEEFSDGIIELDVKYLNPGLYFIKITDKHASNLYKVIIDR